MRPGTMCELQTQIPNAEKEEKEVDINNTIKILASTAASFAAMRKATFLPSAYYGHIIPLQALQVLISFPKDQHHSST